MNQNYICKALNGKQVAILSDGSVVCSCYDKFRERVLGNINDNTLCEIWNNEKVQNAINEIKEGKQVTSFCNICHFRTKNNDSIVRKTPGKIIVEYNSDCNLKCLGCERKEIEEARDCRCMDKNTVERLLMSLSEMKDIQKIGFFNHGEPLKYSESAKVIQAIRNVVPKEVKIFTSTNGAYLGTDMRRDELLKSGIDTILFSIDGIDQESYGKYRVNGNFNLVFNNMKQLIQRRNELGKNNIKIIWRYILFKWNDSEQQMDKAIHMADEAGVDEFCFMTTTYPQGVASEKYINGLSGTKYEKYDSELYDVF